MKSSDIINQLRNQLLLYTSLFSDELEIIDLYREGSTAFAITNKPHNFVDNQSATVSGAFYKNEIISISQNGKIVRVETQYDHNLTFNFHKNVTIDGSSNPKVNGTFNLISVINRNCFEYELTKAETLDFTGSPYLKDSFNYKAFNGRHKITVVDATKFSYEVCDIGATSAVGDISVRFNPRISGALSPQRALESYTAKQSQEAWAYVVLGDSFVSKSRHIENDGTDYLGSGATYRQRTISSFSVLVFVSTKDEISGRKARDLMQDIEVYLGKSLLLYIPPNRFSEKVLSGIISVSSTFSLDNKSFYVHSFNYESTEDIVFADTIEIESVSMSTIDLEYRNNNDTIILETHNISLDEDDKT